MESGNALHIIEQMRDYVKSVGLSLMIVGSVGYRSAMLHPKQFAFCDDIDCIFIYSDLHELMQCPYLDAEYLRNIEFYLQCGKADMFSTKCEVDSVKLSPDFISRDYLRRLSQEEISGKSKFRIKLTNAVEVESHIYCNFWGGQICFQKNYKIESGYRFYRLPIHLFVKGSFYPGVLLSKYLYNPTLVCVTDEEKAWIDRIQFTVQEACRRMAAGDPSASVRNTAYPSRRTAFSEETETFLREGTI